MISGKISSVNLTCQCGDPECEQPVVISSVTYTRECRRNRIIHSPSCITLTTSEDIAESGLLMRRHRGKYGPYVTLEGPDIRCEDADIWCDLYADHNTEFIKRKIQQYTRLF